MAVGAKPCYLIFLCFLVIVVVVVMVGMMLGLMVGEVLEIGPWNVSYQGGELSSRQNLVVWEERYWRPGQQQACLYDLRGKP